ncbi:MAG: hypothetical protein GEU95_23715 [Rhizobiales bacterium]|nr:hypothetical protein [Hyphomicrobiales bacterium]
MHAPVGNEFRRRSNDMASDRKIFFDIRCSWLAKKSASLTLGGDGRSLLGAQGVEVMAEQAERQQDEAANPLI